MVLKGRADMRSFTVVSATKKDSCKTKSNGGRYLSTTPFGAAKKAFNELCRVKKIRGVCTLVVTVKETTAGSSNKEFSYKLKRRKLPVPLVRLPGTKNEFVIEYEVVGGKNTSKKSCKKGNQTVGRMAKKTQKKRRLSANNVRKLF